MCVSTLKTTLKSSSKRTTPALSSKTLTHQSSSPSLAANLLRGGEDRLLQHVLEMPLALLVPVGDSAGQRLVAAVLAPGLRQRLQLDVGRIAVQLAEILLDRLHLDQRQVQLAVAAQIAPAARRPGSDRHLHQLERVRLSHVQVRQVERPDDHLLDRIVGQHLAAQQRQLIGRQFRKPDFLQRADSLDRDAEIGDGLQSALRHRVHHAGFGQHMDDLRAAVGSVRSAPLHQFARSPSVRPLHRPAVREQVAGRRRALDRLPAGSRGRCDTERSDRAEISGLGGSRPRCHVRLPSSRVNVNFPQSHEFSFLHPRVVRQPVRRRLPARHETARALSQTCPATSRPGGDWPVGSGARAGIAGRDAGRVAPTAGGQRQLTWLGRSRQHGRDHVRHVAGHRHRLIVIFRRHPKHA